MAFLNESSILKKVAEGDEKAFSYIYKSFKPDLYRLVFNILKSPDLTNDTCQEVFIKIWEERHKLTGIYSFKNYLLVSGRNHSINVLKKVLYDEKRLTAFIENYTEEHNGIEDKIQSEEYQRFFQATLSTLTPQSKKVFTLCRQQGMSYEEAAHSMGVSSSLIKKHMVRSMKILRNAVERDLGIAFSFFMPLFIDFGEQELCLICG
jgi:RNA polymerase sigma-70 factor (family 1)